jgi:putative oxidoreductase
MNTSQTFAGSGANSSATLGRVEELAGRVLLGALFLPSGLAKIGTYGATSAYMASMGVPGALLPLVILTEVLGSLMIIFGFKTRVVAFLLGGYCVLSAVFFHHNFADQNQLAHFLKDIAIAGAFLMLLANGAGPLSVDRRIARSRKPAP